MLFSIHLDQTILLSHSLVHDLHKPVCETALIVTLLKVYYTGCGLGQMSPLFVVKHKMIHKHIILTAFLLYSQRIYVLTYIKVTHSCQQLLLSIKTALIMTYVSKHARHKVVLLFNTYTRDM